MTMLSTPLFFPLNTALAGFAEPQEKVSATLKIKKRLIWLWWSENCLESLRLYLSVPAEAEHDVVDLVLEDEVVVIIGGSQLDILDDELIQHDVYCDHCLL